MFVYPPSGAITPPKQYQYQLLYDPSQSCSNLEGGYLSEVNNLIDPYGDNILYTPPFYGNSTTRYQ
jgi:hypothetical protein